MTGVERFKILNKFIGYGDLERAQLFIVGLEEGGSAWTISQEDERRIQRRATCSYLTRDRWDDDISNWRNYFKITNRMETYLATTLRRVVNYVPACELELRQYFCEEFGASFEFQTNVYPLACPRQSCWPGEYSNLFFDNRTLKKEEYYRLSLDSGRVDVLRNLVRIVRDSTSPKWMVVLTYQAWNELQDRVFAPERISFPCQHEWSRAGHQINTIKYSPDKRFWLCGHPFGGWFNKHIADFMIDEIRRT